MPVENSPVVPVENSPPQGGLTTDVFQIDRLFSWSSRFSFYVLFLRFTSMLE